MTKKSIRAVAATTMMALALSFGAGSAFAEPSRGGGENLSTVEQLGAANIDVKHPASITIHKLLNPESTHKATGVEDRAAKGKKLSGVRFTITKLSLELDNQENLKTAATLTAEQAQALKSGTKYDVTTADQGMIKQQLPVGVYLVEENQLRDGDDVRADGEKVEKPSEIKAAAPFVVRVPMSNGEKKDWNYDVHVYPKNTSDKLEKKVIDAGRNGGDTITYTIDASVPQVDEEYTRTVFNIVDDYDETKLEPGSIQIESVVMGQTAFEKGVDFETSDDNKRLTITFKTGEKVGLSKLVNNQVVTVKLTAKIKEAGEIVNKATRITRDTSVEEDKTKNTNDVKTYLGKIKVIKTGIEGKKLSGAEFGVFRCTPAGSTWNLNGDAIETLKTNAQGEAISKPLHVTDFENNLETVTKPENQNYCLKETKAPDGYLLSEEITHFTLAKADVLAKSDFITFTKEIENKPSDTPDLPLTGGQGIALLVILGAGVAGAAVYSARRNSTKA
ncbi:SpaH/EbpB family LPXTG-anchored major pilin [Arcanobacterium canis]|uniref:SpaH/EbpB family LPXTG-anchored major pilin n=1 Tax=Arcanobacterium canis TaxID=999183 RepID=A0ABY8G0S3_9ACTO|nr:SpaH/EbpB family LPXTG-anchored major pilin [Arcanobacterium canis]WFM83630.1 SpaH/EbpB family LPXTG-anchored major pilin [Arcanobacterium canis]